MAFQGSGHTYLPHDEYRDSGFRPGSTGAPVSAFSSPGEPHRDHDGPLYRTQLEPAGMQSSRQSPPFPAPGERPMQPEQFQTREESVFYTLTGGVPPARPDYERDLKASSPRAMRPIWEPSRPVFDTRGSHPADQIPDTFSGREPATASLAGFDSFPETAKRRATENKKGLARYNSQRRAGNRDEFDGPVQLLEMPAAGTIAALEKELPHLPTTLYAHEQDNVLYEVNDVLSRCAFHFIAKYQFPIPVEPDKRQVRAPTDREWTEWAYLLKRLATKRRIPARVLYNGQIKQFVTVLDNSLEMRHAAKHQSRPVKDDRNILQLISAGTQVAKILKDAAAMEHFDQMYLRIEQLIQERRQQTGNISI